MVTRLESIEARVRASTRDDGRPSGHGHVFKRADGARARCGGPGICDECSRDHVIKSRPNDEADLLRWVRVLRDEVLSLTELINDEERPLECIVEPQSSAILREMDASHE